MGIDPHPRRDNVCFRALVPHAPALSTSVVGHGHASQARFRSPTSAHADTVTKVPSCVLLLTRRWQVVTGPVSFAPHLFFCAKLHSMRCGASQLPLQWQDNETPAQARCLARPATFELPKGSKGYHAATPKTTPPWRPTHRPQTNPQQVPKSISEWEKHARAPARNAPATTAPLGGHACVQT